MATQKAVEAEDLKAQFELLREEMKELTEMMTLGAKERAEIARDRAVTSATRLSHEAQDTVAQLQEDAERAISRNPLGAIAVFAGIGFLLGMVTRR